ncbi:MAG TPA: SpoIIE family protein phosphatase, partial [bacterium]
VTAYPLASGSNLIASACLIFNKADDADLKPDAYEESAISGYIRITALGLASILKNIQKLRGRSPYTDAVHSIPGGVLIADESGIVIDVNDAFTDLTRIPESSLKGRDLTSLPMFGPDCDFMIARLLEKGEPFELVSKFNSDESGRQFNPGNVEGEKDFVRLRGTSLKDRDGNPSGMVLFADNVTAEVMAQREVSKREYKYNQEIELAKRLQQDFFPENYQKKRIKISTKLLAASELAGDFFDIIHLGPNTIGLMIGDVVGKGIPGSLMAMSVHAMLMNQAGALTPPMKVLERVSDSLYHQVKGDYWYATCFYAKIHVTQLTVTYSRAGHELPLWWHCETGETEFLENDGMPLGIFGNNRYTTQQVILKEGDRLLFYTDGLTDTVNDAGERFGHERLNELFRRYSSLSQRNLLQLIEDQIAEFRGGREQLDDIAIALISVVPDSWTTLSIPPYSFPEVLEGLIDELVMRGVDDDIRFRVRLSIDECVTNAHKHGHKGDHRKPVIVSYIIEQDKLIFKVKDSGQGFDFGLIPDPTLEENLMHPGGRGVFLTLKLMDEVSFNDVGNEITVIKYLHVKS